MGTTSENFYFDIRGYKWVKAEHSTLQVPCQRGGLWSRIETPSKTVGRRLGTSLNAFLCVKGFILNLIEASDDIPLVITNF